MHCAKLIFLTIVPQGCSWLYLIMKICLLLSAHGLEVSADGPQLHRSVLGPRDQLVIVAVDSRVAVAPPGNKIVNLIFYVSKFCSQRRDRFEFVEIKKGCCTLNQARAKFHTIPKDENAYGICGEFRKILYLWI